MTFCSPLFPAPTPTPCSYLSSIFILNSSKIFMINNFRIIDEKYFSILKPWVVHYRAPWRTFKPKLEKLKKKIHPIKISYISWNGTFQPHIFLIFQGSKTFRTQETKKPTLKRFFLYFRARKRSKHEKWKKKKKLWKDFFYFWKQNFLAPSLIFQEAICKAWKTNKKICSDEICCVLWRFCNLFNSKP